MKDKYSKFEEKLEEGIRRTNIIEDVLNLLEVKKDILFCWELVSVKLNREGLRLNVVEIKCKSSNARFIMNQKIKEIEKKFEEAFFDNLGQKEKIVFRIR